ncbi:flagellin [Devosia rhodophyticola]|uniref:Flagellin n=1 Tax=Devosia rhodophyticola TaxID=3026423 RepID=A0ABY7YWF0_9HYPH|nr:flagellin [Devosia rhodophyticola]WDR05413.1 flagellin [Devosia rhodophyticola]
MAEINLTQSVRSNLSSLQNVASMMSKTQTRLSTGNKVNSALDNPTNFFTASSLNNRAGDLNNLMDSMANGIKTIEAADNGLTSITKTLESMQSTLTQARQDKSFQTKSFDIGTIDTSAIQNLAISGGAVTGSIDVALNTADVATTAATLTAAAGTDLSGDADLSALDGQSVTLTDGTNTATYTFTNAAAGQKAALEAALSASGFTATGVAGGLNVSRADGVQVTLTTSNAATATAMGIATGTTSTDGVAGVTGTASTVDELVASINANTDLTGKVRASNDNGKLRIENQSTQDLTVTGLTDNKITGGVATSDISGNTVRADLAKQFNELRDQLDKLSDDASFNGINLLRGDNLKITFNETGSSSIDIHSKGNAAVNATNLMLPTTLVSKDLDGDTGIDGYLTQVKSAMNTVRSQASAFGSNLSIVQNRQDFTKSMIDTLETGAGNLTLADMNQEAANMLALQTRQSLAQSTLSMANQADQGVLQLLR